MQFFGLFWSYLICDRTVKMYGCVAWIVNMYCFCPLSIICLSDCFPVISHLHYNNCTNWRVQFLFLRIVILFLLHYCATLVFELFTSSIHNQLHIVGTWFICITNCLQNRKKNSFFEKVVVFFSLFTIDVQVYITSLLIFQVNIGCIFRCILCNATIII